MNSPSENDTLNSNQTFCRRTHIETRTRTHLTNASKCHRLSKRIVRNRIQTLFSHRMKRIIRKFDNSKTFIYQDISFIFICSNLATKYLPNLFLIIQYYVRKFVEYLCVDQKKKPPNKRFQILRKINCCLLHFHTQNWIELN